MLTVKREALDMTTGTLASPFTFHGTTERFLPRPMVFV